MNSTSKKQHITLRENRLGKLFFISIILLIPLLLSARRLTSAHTSDITIPGDLLVLKSLTPAFTATSTRTPTLTATPAPTAFPETFIKVYIDNVNLRSGPGTNFSKVVKLLLGDSLVLMGRLSDNSWLYVRTSAGQEGWIISDAVNLRGINIRDQHVITPPPGPEPVIRVFDDNVNLRTGPGTHFSKVRKVTSDEKLFLLGRLSDNSWLYVKTSDGQKGWIKTSLVDLTGINLLSEYHPIQTPPPTETSTPVVLVGIDDHWIDIDLSEQRLYAYDGTNRVNSFLVSTGTDLYPTETGQYKIYVKYVKSDMHGNDYFLPDVPYTMYYSGDFSIHGTYWHHNFGTPMSRGCVNMDTGDAEWLFNWSTVGTIVNIHR